MRDRSRRPWRAADPIEPLRQVPLPKDIKFVTFDCYGTLIDWESGVYDAFQRRPTDGFTIDRNGADPAFIEVQREIQRGSYELYAEVLRRTAVRVAEELGWDLEPSRSNFLPNSVPAWPPFRETNAQLERFAKKFEIGVLSNIDDKLLGATRRHFRVDFDLVVTAQQVRSYKPDPAHFKECARRIEGQEELGAHRVGLRDRRRALPEAKVPVIWVNRHGQELESGQKRADRGGQDLPRRGQAARAWPGPGLARSRRRHRDALVVTSRMWQTNAVALRSGTEAFLFDSPYFPDELEALPGCSSRPASSRTRSAPPTATSTTCSGGWPSPGCRWAWVSPP